MGVVVTSIVILLIYLLSNEDISESGDNLQGSINEVSNELNQGNDNDMQQVVPRALTKAT